MRPILILAFLFVVVTLTWFSWPSSGSLGWLRASLERPALGTLTFFAQASGLPAPKQDSPMLGAFAASLLIFAYSALILIRIVFPSDAKPLSTLQKKRRIDSIYFLGFILTLISLVIALGSANAEDPTTTLTQNAVALTSTALALVIRTVWLMLLPDEKELPEEQSVEDGFEALSAKLSSLANQIEMNEEIFKRGSSQLEQHLQNTISASTDFFEKSRSMLMEQTQNSIKDFNSKLNGYTNTLDNRVKKINEIEIEAPNIERQIAEAGSSALNALRTEIETAGRLVASMNQSSQTAEQKFDAAFENFSPQQSLTDALIPVFEPVIAASTSNNDALARVSKDLEESSVSILSTLSKLVSAINEKLGEVEGLSNVQMTPQQTRETQETFRIEKEQISQLTQAIRQLETTVRQSNNPIVQLEAPSRTKTSNSEPTVDVPKNATEQEDHSANETSPSETKSQGTDETTNWFGLRRLFNLSRTDS